MGWLFRRGHLWGAAPRTPVGDLDKGINPRGLRCNPLAETREHRRSRGWMGTSLPTPTRVDRMWVWLLRVQVSLVPTEPLGAVCTVAWLVLARRWRLHNTTPPPPRPPAHYAPPVVPPSLLQTLGVLGEQKEGE